MLVLALETVTRAGSVAVMDGATCHATTGDPTRTHGERLPGDVTSWLARFGKTLGDVDLFAIISGPGSFTGLRVGMAAIQGFALSLGRQVVAVPTLEALARGWLTHTPVTARTLIVPCLDGQRHEVFSAGWELDSCTPFEAARAIFEPRVGAPDALAADLRRWAASTPVTLVGDGARRYETSFASSDLPIRVADAPVPLAEIAARVAAADPSRAVAPHALRPIYIRRPDAVLARARAQAQTREAEPGVEAEARSSPDFAIARASTPEDVVAVEALQRRTFTNPWAAESIRWELEHTDVARLYVMRAPDGRVVAYCACWIIFDELHINSLAVDEAWRRRGLARRLLEAVLADAAASGAQSATLEVRRSNDAARALYEGLGFGVDAVRRDYYQHPREDALILWNRRVGK